MKLSHLMADLSIALVGAGCSADLPEPEAMPGSPLERLIHDFHASVHPGTRALSMPTISDVSSVYYTDDGETAQTRTDSTQGTFSISTVDLDFGTNRGYAIVYGKGETLQMLMYAEYGSVSDTTYNVPLKEHMELLPAIGACLAGGYSEPTRAGSDFVIEPICNFKWGQYLPFNAYTPPCTCDNCKSNGGHYPIGCVTVAVAQTIATIGYFPGTFYGNNKINFQNLPAKGWYFTSTQGQTVAQFMHEVALGCQVKFGCGGSGSTIKAAYQFLREYGWNYQYAEGEINVTTLRKELEAGYPHIMSGGRANGNRHAWIVDGIKYEAGKHYFHSNWGWDGRSDFWVIDVPHTFKYEKDGPVIYDYNKDKKHLYINTLYPRL